MSDLFVELGRSSSFRQIVQGLGLPLPLPEDLERATGPMVARPIEDRRIVVGVSPGATLAGVVATTLAAAGAEAFVVGDDATLEVFRGPGEAYGRRPRRLSHETSSDGPAPQALVFDASGIETTADLTLLHSFFRPQLGGLARSGRIVVLGCEPDAMPTAEGAAAQEALEGFVRSLGKEVGKRGATANLVQVSAGAASRVEAVLRFLLSPRSAFVTDQVLPVRALCREVEAIWVRPLDRKVALVTGAARGIGAATARRLADEGAHVVCLDRPADEELASGLAKAIGGSVLLADVTDPAAPEAIASALREAHGGVDVVVHNAGITRDKTLGRMSTELWEQAIDVNLGAVLRIQRAIADDLLRDGGRVVCLSSVAGIAGNVGQTNYAASKAGLLAYVRHEAKRLADRGIGVSAVAPGFIETRLTEAIPVVIREVARRLAALGQGGRPEDVAEAISFLSTPGAQGLSGSVLRVCGGAFIGA